MTQTNKCQHDGEMKTGWDELTCKKCFWILPSGQRIGKHFGWFPSHEAHKEFKKYRTYTGMDNTYPIDTTKYDEVQNITQNNEREAFDEFEDLLEQLYWEFATERAKKSRGERDIFKGKLRFIAKKFKAPTTSLTSETNTEGVE